MAKLARELGALAVQRLRSAGRYAVGGVPGLYLQVREPDEQSARSCRTWLLRIKVGKKRRDIGLGGYPAVSLAQAREKAQEVRRQIEAGIDPVLKKREARSALKAAQARAVTFQQCAEAYIATNEPGWRNAKHAQQFRNTLATYVFPTLDSLHVEHVTREAIIPVLRPIWTTKTETATRVRQRIEAVLSYAMQHGHMPEGLNPARWKGGLDKVLPSPAKIAKPVHHRALPIDEAPAFMRRLRSVGGQGARALELAILCASRSGEVRLAKWQEFDLDRALWVVPAERMKAGKEHRVPLSKPAVQLLKALTKGEQGGLVFEGGRGAALSDMTLSAVMRRLEVDAVPHGFRSTFKDWAAERTNVPNEVTEMALAHAVGDKVEAAYRRGDLFEKRRLLMAAWAAFLEGQGTARLAAVVLEGSA